MIAIISDVHGNYTALKSVIREILDIGCKEIISLGDIGGYYCMINECIDLCREYDVKNILGNHDYYLTTNTGCPRSTSANICLDYQRSIIRNDNIEWLKMSVNMIDTDIMSMRHGGWNDPLDEYISQFYFESFIRSNQKIYLSGHTHVQQILSKYGIIYANPGSVGQPRDGNPSAAFLLIDNNGNVLLRRKEYDIDEIVSAMKSAGFDEKIYSCLYSGTKIGG